MPVVQRLLGAKGEGGIRAGRRQRSQRELGAFLRDLAEDVGVLDLEVDGDDGALWMEEGVVSWERGNRSVGEGTYWCCGW